MRIDVSKFHHMNIVDTCAVWHVLSSQRLYRSARAQKIEFFVTEYVLYECLLKPRSKPKSRREEKKLHADQELCGRLTKERNSGGFKTYHLDVDDLQNVTLLKERQRLGLGELASIALALKIRQAFMTDDQKARKLAESEMRTDLVQTTPHLFGWLIYEGLLSDSDKDVVIHEHNEMTGELEPYLLEIYHEALRCRLMMSPSLS